MGVWEIALAVISVIAAVITIYDKVIAGSGRRRVPEQTLFLLALLGGAAAMYVTMLLIRHKTKHKRFMLGLPLIVAIQLAAWWVL
ncbi:MAG: DUF1294 domain-containing protein [Clostridia bacterium]|nr:DUF1294 domain-containing protein [Clostridia bacterium]